MIEQNKETMGLGPNGECVCHRCGYETRHQAGVPCQEVRCPDCGVKLMRKGGHHHDLAMSRRKPGTAPADQT